MKRRAFIVPLLAALILGQAVVMLHGGQSQPRTPDTIPATSYEEFHAEQIQRIQEAFSDRAEDLTGLFQYADFDSFIIGTMDSFHVPGVAACVVQNGDVIWHGEFGFADIGDSIEVTDSTLFMLASISKTFVATALMQLWEDGLFDLDDDVNLYLPFAVRNPYHPDEPITFRMILSHVSSIARNDQFWVPLITWGADSPMSLDWFLENWLLPGGDLYRHDNFKGYPPGAGGEYSNIAFTLAGFLVEMISGRPFEEYCQESVFGPLGMTETSWFLSGLDASHIAVPTGHDGGEYYPYGQYGFPAYPAGQLRTSALQLARHLIAFMHNGRIDGHQVLDSLTVQEMTTIQYPNIRVFPETPEIEWGLGWYRIDTNIGYVWGHDGGLYGVSTSMYCQPDAELGIVLLTNGDGNEGTGLILEALILFAMDGDADGIINGFDNCPFVLNPGQEDRDGDGIGDICLRGDVNLDDEVDVLDVVTAIRYILGLEPLDETARWRADCNGDGHIDIADVLGMVGAIIGEEECPQDGI